MAILNFCGAETGDAIELSASSGLQYSQAIKKNGNFAYRCFAVGTGTAYGRFGAPGSNGFHSTYNVATLYLGFWFYYKQAPIGYNEEIITLYDTGSSYKCAIRLDWAGRLCLASSAAIVVATGTTQLQPDTWYYISASIGTHASAASYSIYINGQLELSGTAATGGTNHGLFYFGKVNNRYGNNVDFYFDDIVLDDATLPTGQVIERLPVTGQGWYTDFTGDYSAVSEIPHNGDTNYLVSSTSGHAETVIMTPQYLDGAINSIKPLIVVRDEGGSSVIQIMIRSNGVDYVSTGYDPGATYTAMHRIYNTEPGTGLPWTKSDLALLEVGVKLNAAAASRCTMMTVQALYTPSRSQIYG